MVAVLMVAVSCASPNSSGDPSSSLGDDDREATEAVTADPVVSRLTDRQWSRMVKTGTWRPGCPVSRVDLRRLEVNYVTFAGTIKRGAIVAHQDSVEDLASILTSLFDARFPIQRMRPVEKYEGDLTKSLKANNTSAFNCRRPDQINAPTEDSPHANGRAIDINPYQNPWKDPRCDCWSPSRDFAKRRTGDGVIVEGSLPWQLFIDRGWIWQNIKTPDYMHFDTGFPSRSRIGGAVEPSASLIQS